MAAQDDNILKEYEKYRKSIQISILKPGDAINFPKLGDSVMVHYIGYLEDKTMVNLVFLINKLI